MSNIKRVRGDNYPIIAVLSTTTDGVKTITNLTDATVVFSYEKSGLPTASIAGTITDALNGVVQFLPVATDFTEAGTYRYDIQRIAGTIKTTHVVGQLVLEDDVGKS